jgi:hypothetical protein
MPKIRGFFLQGLHHIVGEFETLFSSGVDEGGDEGGRSIGGGGGFAENYGWYFNAKQVADFENVTVSAAFELNVIQYLNILSYLKAKAEHDAEQQRKLMKRYAH